MRRFAAEYWSPVFVGTVAAAVWWGSRIPLPLDVRSRIPEAAALCWAFWGGAMLEGAGRIRGRAASWAFCVFAIAAAGAVVWPGDFFRFGLISLLWLATGVEYGALLGVWAPVAVTAVPATAAVMAYVFADVLSWADGVRIAGVLGGPLGRLFSGGEEAVLSAVLYSVLAVVLRLWGGRPGEAVPGREKTYQSSGADRLTVKK